MATPALAEGSPRRTTNAVAVREALRVLSRPYRVTLPMAAFVLLIPLYIFIPVLLLPGRTLHTLQLPVDGLLPLKPAWAVVYGALYLFLIVLPVLIVRDERHVRLTVQAYLTVWITAYICFVLYPTAAPRPASIVGQGFGTWALRLLYSADPPYNCFPSLHVAHSFVSAFTCFRLSRGIGLASGIAASLVGVSTLYTKQHYVLDVVAGIGLSIVAYVIFLRPYSDPSRSEIDRRVSAVLAVGLMLLVGLVVAAFWGVYRGVA